MTPDFLRQFLRPCLLDVVDAEHHARGVRVGGHVHGVWAGLKDWREIGEMNTCHPRCRLLLYTLLLPRYTRWGLACRR